jgi:hypothetical protein
MCRALAGDAFRHRAILQGGYDRFLEMFMATAHEHGLPITDCEPVYQWLNRNRPPWLHELPTGTLLDEHGFPLKHPDAEELRAAERVLRAQRTASAGVEEILREFRARAVIQQEREDAEAAYRASFAPDDPTG